VALSTVTTRAEANAVVLALASTGDNAAGVSAVAELAHPLITSTWDRPAMLLDAIRAGARGCITRHCEPDAVRTAVRVVAGYLNDDRRHPAA
jgi:DNA-binding NarL/FixJ family response regulator